MDLSLLMGRDTRITVLAGAGLSAPAPTCLPGWWALNDAVLGALGGAIERLARRPGISDDFRDAIRQRRDSTPFLMPDLQAQLLEDELGPDYFRALSAVDSGAPNAGHVLIAELARQGRLAAVLTTNFDGAIERAFEALGLAYQRYASPEDFELLGDGTASIPIVKIHGSADRPDTMVDTLRQRLHGRPASLEQWMHQHFVRFPTLGLGFSGEDLQYDPDYLAIRPAIRDGARFRFLVRTGSTPSVPIQRLVAEFPQHVSTGDGDLPGWLFQVADALGVQHEIPVPAEFDEEVVARTRAAVAQRLDESLEGWATSLGPMAALNAVTSLLSAAGHRHVADYLLRRMWTSYRAPTDSTGPSYARYLHNYGEILLREGNLRNPHDRESDLISWKHAADRDPWQFFARAAEQGGAEDSLARSILCHFLSGANVAAIAGPAAALLDTITTPREEGASLPRTLIDAAFSLAELLELIGLGQAALPLLEDAYRSSRKLGDEYRRATAAWRLARNLAFALDGSTDSMARVTLLAEESRAIASRLGLREADAGAALAEAIVASVRGDWALALDRAVVAEGLFHEVHDLPGEIFAKRERVHALIRAAVDGKPVDGAQFDELSAALQRFAIDNAPGLRPLIKLELARLASFLDHDLARELATDAAHDAQLQGHPVIVGAAGTLLEALTKGE